MKLFIKALLLLSTGGWVMPAFSAQNQVVTAHPAVQMLAAAILENTSIRLTYLPPKRLPVKRIPNWLKRSRDRVAEASVRADAMVTIASVWPAFAFYGHVRSVNIGVVPIDVATELNIPGRRIKRSVQGEKTASYFWLSPDNLVVMSDIMASDLARLFPDQARLIQANHQTLRQAIQQTANAIEAQLLMTSIEEVCLSHPELMPLAESLYLPIVPASQCSRHGLMLEKRQRQQDGNQPIWFVDAMERVFSKGMMAWLKQHESGLRGALAVTQQ